MFGKEGPGTYYTQMSAIFVILCTLVPQTLQNIVLRRGCFPGHFPNISRTNLRKTN